MIKRLKRLLMIAHYVITYPVSIVVLLDSKRIRKEYRMTLLRKFWLGYRMLVNKLRVQTGTSSRAHMAMALKLFETPSDVPGDVVECGT